MPTYEYECGSCGVFEVFQSIKDDAFKRCPTCGDRRIRRLISGGGGVIFKGDGFWETDYNRSEDYRKAAKQDTEGTKPDKVEAAKSKEGSGASEGAGKTKVAPAAPASSTRSGAKEKAKAS